MVRANRSFYLLGVVPEVEVTPSFDYYFELEIQWRGDYRHCLLNPKAHPYIALTGVRGDNEITRLYPDHLGDDIYFGIYGGLMQGTFRFYEIDSNGERRFDNLRFHNLDEYHYNFDLIARQCAKRDLGRFTDLFRATTTVGQLLWRIGADEGEVILKDSTPFINEGIATVGRVGQDEDEECKMGRLVPIHLIE